MCIKKCQQFGKIANKQFGETTDVSNISVSTHSNHVGNHILEYANKVDFCIFFGNPSRDEDKQMKLSIKSVDSWQQNIHFGIQISHFCSHLDYANELDLLMLYGDQRE